MKRGPQAPGAAAARPTRVADRKPALFLLVAAVVAILAPGAAAGQSLEGLPIRAIEFEGLSSLAAETLEFYLALEEGAAYDRDALNRNLHRLWGTQLIDDVTVEAVAEGDGVRLRITVRERPTLRSIEYEGLKRISRTDVTDRIAKDRIQVREGDPVNLGELHRLKSVIEEIYAEKGYRLAEASFTLETVSPSDRRVFFTIDEGDKVRVADIDFEGNTVFRDARLRWSMKKTKETGFITRLFKKDIYKAAAFEEDLDKVRDLYRRAGYKNVVLGEPKVEVRAARPEADDPTGQKRRLFLTVPVEEGDRWKLGQITIEGNERFKDDLLLRQFRKPSGGWLRSNVIQDGLEAVQELYSNTGHLFAQVEPEVVERDDQVADVLVRIDEGDQFRVGRIEFEGNLKTRDKVIRREMGIQEGLVLNSGALRNSLRRIQQLEFFKINEDDPVGFDFDNENKLVDLTVRGEEGDRTEMLFGGGFSEIDGFFGQFQFRTRNFRGRGETLGVSIQSGSRQDIYDLSYFVPWFLDRPQSVGLQVFQRNFDVTLIGGQRSFQESAGGTVTYGRNLGLFRNLSLSYSRFDVEDRFTDPTGQFPNRQFDRSVSSMRLSFVRDTRDSRLQPTVGTRGSATLDYTGGVLGGTTDFWRPQASFSLYRPVSKGRLGTVAAFNVEAGIIEPFGAERLFPNDRFYLGGENSVRGFRFRAISVRDKDGLPVLDEFGIPLGGDSFLQLNFEYIFLLGGPFRLLGFADGGNVFADDQSFSFDGFRYTYGLELQVNVPILGAPLRFIFAQNPSPLPGDRFETFQFSVGPSF